MPPRFWRATGLLFLDPHTQLAYSVLPENNIARARVGALDGCRRIASKGHDLHQLQWSLPNNATLCDSFPALALTDSAATVESPSTCSHGGVWRIRSLGGPERPWRVVALPNGLRRTIMSYASVRSAETSAKPAVSARPASESSGRTARPPDLSSFSARAVTAKITGQGDGRAGRTGASF